MDFSNTSSPELPKPLKSTKETNTLYTMTLSSSLNINSRKTLPENNNYEIKLPKSKATNNLIEISKFSPNEKSYFCSNSEKHLDDMKNTQKRLTIMSQNKNKRVHPNQEKSETKLAKPLDNAIPVKNKFHIKILQKLDSLFQSRRNNKVHSQTTIMENRKKEYKNLLMLSPDLPVIPSKKLKMKTKVELSKKSTYSSKKSLLILFTRSEKNEIIEGN